jgi:hypothetical protein
MAKLSAEDKRIMAEIKAEIAEKKKSKGGAKDLVKELADAKKARKVPKFNSKGQSAAKEEAKKPAAKKKKVLKKPEAKKPAAKKPAAKKKPEAKKTAAKKKKVLKKPAAKKTRKTVSKLVKSLKKGSKAGNLKPDSPKTPKQKFIQSLKDSRTKPEKPTSAKVKPKITGSTTNPNGSAKIKQTSARGKASTTGGSTTGNKSVIKSNSRIKDVKGTNTTAKPKLLRGPATIGPAGERISPQSKKVPSKLMNKVLSVGKNVVGGPLGALGAAATLYNMVHPDKVKERTGPSKAGFGTKKPKPKPTQAATSTTDKKDTGKKKSTTVSSFGAAFRKAKDDGLKVFPWNGKSYSTATKDEVKKSGSKNLREHLNKQNKKKSK